jgi:hypothetical protein
MKRISGVCVVLLLALGLFASPALAQQRGTGRQDRPSGLRQNYPNPMNPETNIPFELGPELFEGGKQALVTVRIYSVLRQLVAIPVARSHPLGGAPPIQRLEYSMPGSYEAYWDGLNRDGRKVASGIYFVLLEVNGRRYGELLKMTVAK